MNNSYKSQNRGSWVIPSARPSIHDHANCPFGSRRVMVRFSADDTPSNRLCGNGSSHNNHQGTDEVDNVMSKFAQRGSSPVSPVPIANKRRSSYDAPSSQNTDDSSDDNLFAKSLPAQLPSHYHCSDGLGTSAAGHDSSTGSGGSSFHNHSRESIPNVVQDTSSNLNSPNLSINQGRNLYTSSVLAVLGIAAIVAGLWQGEPHTDGYDEPRFYNELNNIGEKYRISENSILQVQTGISTIFAKQDAGGSFIFVYNSRDHFDQNVFNNLINAVATASARYLRNGSASVQPTTVNVLELEIQSDSELINRYRDDVTRTGVMLVKELDRVPWKLAMAFHYYCDDSNPLAKKSAIFFTLDMAKCSSTTSTTQPTHAYIEDCLAKKWNGVPKDKIKPLLARVVGIIVNLTSSV